MVEELTDVQAFDQSPKVELVKDSSRLVMVSQERGFKSFLERSIPSRCPS